MIDRLWPRGLSKEKAQIDFWPREIAPSTELRKWYQHDAGKWPQFIEKYFEELEEKKEVVEEVYELITAGPVTFVFSSREEKLNNAHALKEYFESRVK